MADGLATFKPKGSGLYLKFEDGDEVKLRILTLDPIVSDSTWENSDGETVISTKYAFIVWNFNEDKAQIMQVGPGLVKRFKQIHLDADYDPINKIDIKISATGEKLKRRYTVDVLPIHKTQLLNNAMIKEAAGIDLESNVQDAKGRLSELEEGEDIDTVVTSAHTDDDIPVIEEIPAEGPGKKSAREVADKLGGTIEDEEDIDISAIPF